MTNPIADPLVENVVTEDIADLVRLDASPEGVAFVTINRPASGNAFDGETVKALSEAFETLHGADHVRIVFLRGEGGVFCTGLDLDWMQVGADWTEADHRADALAVGRMLEQLSNVPAFTVALVEGAALGTGAGLVAACDAAVAAADARFAFPEVAAGLIPAMVAPYVVDAIGARAAKSLFATGREFDAAHAARIGLVEEVVEGPEALMAAQERYAEMLSAAAPSAVAEVKRLIAEAVRRPADLMDDSARRLAALRISDEGREGVAAFVEQRRANWRDA